METQRVTWANSNSSNCNSTTVQTPMGNNILATSGSINNFVLTNDRTTKSNHGRWFEKVHTQLISLL